MSCGISVWSFIGTAYVHGIQHATGDFIFILDADMSHHVRSDCSTDVLCLAAGYSYIKEMRSTVSRKMKADSCSYSVQLLV